MVNEMEHKQAVPVAKAPGGRPSMGASTVEGVKGGNAVREPGPAIMHDTEG